MKHFFLSILLIFPVGLSAQDLVEFENGKVADADDINSNFTLLSNRISELTGSETESCTAIQQNNTAIIECPDGSRAAIAGYGSVVVFPDGTQGELPAIDINSGEVVVLDTNDTILGEADDISTSGDSFDMEVFSGDEEFSITIRNNVAEQRVDFSAVASWTFYYTDENCTNGPFGGSGRIYDIDGGFKIASGENQGKLLFKSQRESAYISSLDDTKRETTTCVARDEIRSYNFVLVDYKLADEILEAVYPVRVEQLP